MDAARGSTLRAERGGKPLVLALTGGERHEQMVLPTLLEQGAIRRPGHGWPRVRPERVAGNKGSSSRTVRAYLRGRGMGAVIPRRTDEPAQQGFDRLAYRACPAESRHGFFVLQ